MEGILNDGRQIALASLGKSLNERNAQQNEISSKIQQVTEMSKLQENTLTRKKEEFAERWSQTSPVRKAISIAIGIICALVLVWCAVSLFRWIIDVRHLFANAMNYGFFAGILRILWSCVRTILRVAVSVGVIILGILIYFVILGFITANPQKDDAQLNIDKMDEQIQKLVQRFEEMGITVDLNINLYELDVESGSKYLNRIGKYPTITFAQREIPLHMIVLKRLMDILGGIVGLLITAVVTIVLGPMIKLESPGPLFFSQKRVGRNGRIFKIYKFRSMYADAEERKKELMEQNEMDGLMFKMTDDPRITKIGKFIRKTSLDELPQFWNVLKGDMSLVGTRPPTVDEFEQYEGYHKRRLSMTPGLTGVWQVSGRSDITNFEEIVSMDVEYIKNWSLKRDIEIILKTVQVVLHSDGAR